MIKESTETGRTDGGIRKRDERRGRERARRGRGGEREKKEAGWGAYPAALPSPLRPNITRAGRQHTGGGTLRKQGIARMKRCPSYPERAGVARVYRWKLYRNLQVYLCKRRQAEEASTSWKPPHEMLFAAGGAPLDAATGCPLLPAGALEPRKPQRSHSKVDFR